MSDVLEERLANMDRRLVAVESHISRQSEELTTLLVELKVLQARVSLYAAAISVAVSLLVKHFV